MRKKTTDDRLATLERWKRSVHKRSWLDPSPKTFTTVVVSYLSLADGAIVGDQEGLTVYSKWMKSSNFSAGVDGWRITGGGSAEFNDVVIRGTVYATAGEIGGWTINADNITGGNATLHSTGVLLLGTVNDIVRLDAADATYRLWVGHAAAASAPFRVSKAGAVTATSGTVGGWTLGVDALTGGNASLQSAGRLLLGTGTDIIIASATDASYRLWVGHTAPGSAPFRVTKAGALTATDATITGTITATTGAIGGWAIGASALTGGNAILYSAGVLLLGTGNDIVRLDAADATYRIWIGHVAAASAPFRVTKAGAVTATDATITGTIDANAGHIGTLDIDGVLTVGSAPCIQLDGPNKRIESTNFASGVSGFRINSGGDAEFNNVAVRGSLHCTVFVKDLLSAHAGTQIIAKSAGVLSDAMVVPASGSWYLYLTDPPGGGFLFDNSDVSRTKDLTATGVKDTWFEVLAQTDMGDGRQRYTCTYRSGDRPVTYPEGGTVIDYGVSGQGLLLMTAGLSNAPYYDVLTHAGSPWTTQTLRLRLGNLEGVASVGAEYGLWAGQNETNKFLLLSDTNFEVHGLDVKLYDGASNTVRLNPSTPSLAMGSTLPSGFGTGAGIWMGKDTTYKFRVGDPAGERVTWDTSGLRIYDGDGDVAFEAAPSGSVWLSSLAISEDLGQMFFSDADGLALWGPGCKITDTAWTSTRGQAATISGAFRQVPGRWPGTRGLAVEPAGTNYIINPISGVNVTDGWTNNGMATYERSTTYAKFGSASMHLVSDATTDDVYSDTVSEADGGEDWTAVVWVYLVSGDFQVTISENDAGWTDKDSQAGGTIGRWERVVLSVELTAGVTDGRVKLEPAATAASEFYVGYVGFHPTAYALTAIYGSFGTGYTWSGTAHNSTSTRTATEVNLDAHVGLISGNATLTFAMWVQMPYDADATWANSYVYLLDAYNPGRILIQFRDQKFVLYIDGGYRIWSAVQTFKSGDWLHFVVTLDFASDSYAMYIDGSVRGTSAATLSAPVLSKWRLGASNVSTLQTGFVFGEHAVFDRVLTTDEVAAMYALQRPLVDFGAVNKPGIFILDGQFRMASSLTGNRIDITADEIAGYDSAGTKQFYLQASDGKAMAGGGNVVLDEDGITVAATGTSSYVQANSYNFIDDGEICAAFYCYAPSADNYITAVVLVETEDVTRHANLVLEAHSANSYDANVHLIAQQAVTGTAGILDIYKDYAKFNKNFRVGAGLWVGDVGTEPDDNDVHIEGSINKSTALGCRVYNNANISIANSTVTTLTYNSETFDDDSMHSTSSNTSRLTAVHAGVYLITACVCFATCTGTNQRMILFRVNGTTEIARHRGFAAYAGATAYNLTTIWKLAASSYVECRVYQNRGSALNVEYQAGYSPTFGMVRIA